jgi:hypothetical protein
MGFLSRRLGAESREAPATKAEQIIYIDAIINGVFVPPILEAEAVTLLWHRASAIASARPDELKARSIETDYRTVASEIYSRSATGLRLKLRIFQVPHRVQNRLEVMAPIPGVRARPAGAPRRTNS